MVFFVSVIGLGYQRHDSTLEIHSTDINFQVAKDEN